MSNFATAARLYSTADAVARLPVPRAYVFPSLLRFAWWPPLLFLVKNVLLNITTMIIGAMAVSAAAAD
jgi:hypothetical protein